MVRSPADASPIPTPLVIVTGPPASGKTTLGRRLAADLRLPFLGRDDFKECLFDQLGWSDREWSRRLGRASWHLLFHALEAELAAGRSALIESNFRGEFDTDRFRALRARYAFAPLQLTCRAAGDVLLARFRARAASPERHPGHVETDNLAEFEDALRRGYYEPLDIGGRIIDIDTTDFAALDYPRLLATVRATLDATNESRS